MTTKRIDVYPFNGHNVWVRVVPNGKVLELGKELSQYVEEKWAPKRAKGWKSSWIPFVTEVRRGMVDPYSDKLVYTIEAGVMTYAQTHGMLEAIKEGKNFIPMVDGAPGINNLSIGILPKIVDPDTDEVYLLVSKR